MWDTGVGVSSQNYVLSQTGISGTLQCFYPLLTQLYDLDAPGRAWSEREGAAVLLKLAEAAASQEQESKARRRKARSAPAGILLPQWQQIPTPPKPPKRGKSLLSWIHHPWCLVGQQLPTPQSFPIASCTLLCANKLALCSESVFNGQQLHTLWKFCQSLELTVPQPKAGLCS